MRIDGSAACIIASGTKEPTRFNEGPVTGTAGFIGAAVTERLLARGDEIVGVDSVNEYYDPSLKRARLLASRTTNRTRTTSSIWPTAHERTRLRVGCPQRVIHLAAQAGVRYSIDTRVPTLTRTHGLPERARRMSRQEVEHLTFARAARSTVGTRRHPSRMEMPWTTR